MLSDVYSREEVTSLQLQSHPPLLDLLLLRSLPFPKNNILLNALSCFNHQIGSRLFEAPPTSTSTFTKSILNLIQPQTLRCSSLASGNGEASLAESSLTCCLLGKCTPTLSELACCTTSSLDASVIQTDSSSPLKSWNFREREAYKVATS